MEETSLTSWRLYVTVFYQFCQGVWTAAETGKATAKVKELLAFEQADARELPPGLEIDVEVVGHFHPLYDI